MNGLIWKQDAIDACGGMCACTQDCIDEIRKVPPVDAVEVVRCKDCKFFEEDFWGDIDGAPLIVAHEICTRWGRGCKTQSDGFCHMAEIKDGDDRATS